MINPIDYYYYKIYKAMLTVGGGSLPLQHIGVFVLPYCFNISTILTIITGQVSIAFVVISFVVLYTMSSIYYNSKREKRIIEKYENESEGLRIWGNIIVAIYWIGSLVLFFII